MPAFSEVQVIALAPDEGSVKSGRELANLRKWVSVGGSERALWGDCQGGGSRPYQACIDLSEPAFKCSCPSRKFPCKHGLGLLFLFARDASSFNSAQVPDWVKQWLESRDLLSDKRAKKKEEGESTPDPVAKAKRQSERLLKVELGLVEFRLWLQDRVRQGIAGLERQSYSFWETPAARLTDAQAPGLARQLRQCAGIPNSGEGWQARLLERLSLMHLAAEGYTRIDQLPDDLQQDLRTVIGFTTSQDEVLNSDGVSDDWQIIGQRLDIDDKLKVQRTWLRGEQSRRWALVLSFAFGMQPLDVSLQPGFVIDAELCFFPSASPLRALVKKRSELMQPLHRFSAYKNADEFLQAFAVELGLNPWLEILPIAVDNVVAGKNSSGQFFLIDSENSIIPLGISHGVEWQILAITGGHPFSIFGEWNGENLLPLSLLVNGQLHRIDPRPVVSVT